MDTEIFGYVASIFVGVVLGMLGGGGSILSIPILVYLFDVEPVRASAYSLFVVGMTSLVGSVPKYRDQLVNLRAGTLFGIPSILAIFSTRKWVVPLIPDEVVTLGDFVLTRRLMILGLFAVMMILAAIPMVRGKHEIASEAKEFRPLLAIVQGSLIGFLTGLVGAGGGFLIIPALVFLTGLPFKVAVGTSLFIIAINSLVGFIGDVLNYHMEWPFLLLITGLAVLGILVGNRLSKRFAGSTLKRAFGWLILSVGCYILIRESF